jgi:hypothetical protein
MPPWFVVPDSIVELVFDQPRYSPDTDQYEPSITGHPTHNTPDLIIIDGKVVVPRDIVRCMYLLDPGVGWTPPKNQGKETW